MTENHYELLDLPPTADRPQIKAAYLRALPRVSTSADLVLLHSALGDLLSPRLRAIHDAEAAVPAELRPAIAELRKSIGHDPSSAASRLGNLARAHPYPALLYAAGLLLFGTEQYAKACRILQRLCELEPENAEALNFLGMALEGEGRLGQALASLEKAVALDARQSRACIRVVQEWMGKGRHPTEAVAYLDRSLAACSACAGDRLGLLACLLFPLTMLWDRQRLESTLEEMLLLLPKAPLPAQGHTLSLFYDLARQWPRGQGSVQAEFFERANARLETCLDRLAAADPQAGELDQERARLAADPAVPEWIRRITVNRNLEPADAPFCMTEESMAEENAATFHAWVRLEGRGAEWAAFVPGYPLVASRVPANFCLFCSLTPDGGSAAHPGH